MEPEEIEHQRFPVSRRGYDPLLVDDFLRSVALEYREVLDKLQEASATASPETNTPETFESLGTHVASIMAAAATEAENLRNAAEQNGQLIIQAAEADADSIRREALDELAAAQQTRAAAEAETDALLQTVRAQGEQDAQSMREAAAAEVAQATEDAQSLLATAERTRSEAQTESAAVRSAAKSEADNLYRQAREHAGLLVREAEDRAATIERNLRNKIDSLLSQARTQYKRLRSAQRACGRRLAEIELALRNVQQEIAVEPDLAEELFASRDVAGLEETSAVPEPHLSVRGDDSHVGSEVRERKSLSSQVHQPPPIPRTEAKQAGRRKRKDSWL